MKRLRIYHVLTVLVFICVVSSAYGQLVPDPPIDCPSCDKWNQPREPFRVFGNTYYVGTAKLSAVLITSDDGLIFIDGALPQSAPLIDANIRALGFNTDDIRLILSSHTHFDHAGGIAALQRASHAVVAASSSSAAALRRGGPAPDDPQFAIGNNGFPAVTGVRVIEDGETLTVGDAGITAHFTPGHTPGGTSWSWRSCEGKRCLNMVYADSLTAVSADGFRFTGSSTSPSLVEVFRHSIDMVAKLPCDILLSPHPGFINMESKLQRRREGEQDVFVDRGACRNYAAAAATGLEQRIAKEMEQGE